MEYTELENGLKEIGYKIGRAISHVKIRRMTDNKGKVINAIVKFDNQIELEIGKNQTVVFSLNTCKGKLDNDKVCFSIMDGTGSIFINFYNFDNNK